MLAILVQQWIDMYLARMGHPVRNLRHWALRHRVYRQPLDRWHVQAFASGLSVALHISLFLFFAGLLIYVYALDFAIFLTVLVPSSLALLFYAVTTLAPVFDKHFPTVTPVIVYGRKILDWAALLLCRDNPLACNGCRVIPDDIGADNVDVIAWVFRNKPEECHVAIDAAAQLPADYIPKLASSSNWSSSQLRDHLWQLVNSAEPEQNAAKIATTLHLGARLEDGMGLFSDILSKARLSNVRAHDVGVLANAYRLRLAVLGHPDRPVERARSSATGIFQAVRMWIQDQDTYHVGSMSNKTRSMLYDVLTEAAKRIPDLLSVEQCACALLAFCSDDRAASIWTRLMCGFLDQAVRSSANGSSWTPPDAASDEFRCMCALGWMYMHGYSEPESEISVTLKCHEVAQSFQTLVKYQQRKIRTVHSEFRLQQLIVPFAADVEDASSASICVHNVMQLVISDRTQVLLDWNASIADIFFRLFEHQQPTGEPMNSHIALAFLQTMLPASPERGREELKAIVGAFDSAHAVVNGSVLNLLASRAGRHGERTSLWQLAIMHLTERDHLRRLTKPYTALCAQLSIMSSLSPVLEITDMANHLLADDCGTRFILATDPTTADALEIACHIISFAPKQWADMRVELCASEWYYPGHMWDTPAELVEAAEAAPPCVDCKFAVEILRELPGFSDMARSEEETR